MENIPALIEAAKSVQDNTSVIKHAWGCLVEQIVGEKINNYLYWIGWCR